MTRLLLLATSLFLTSMPLLAQAGAGATRTDDREDRTWLLMLRLSLRPEPDTKREQRWPESWIDRHHADAWMALDEATKKRALGMPESMDGSLGSILAAAGEMERLGRHLRRSAEAALATPGSGSLSSRLDAARRRFDKLNKARESLTSARRKAKRGSKKWLDLVKRGNELDLQLAKISGEMIPLMSGAVSMASMLLLHDIEALRFLAEHGRSYGAKHLRLAWSMDSLATLLHHERTSVVTADEATTIEKQLNRLMARSFQSRVAALRKLLEKGPPRTLGLQDGGDALFHEQCAAAGHEKLVVLWEAGDFGGFLERVATFRATRPELKIIGVTHLTGIARNRGEPLPPVLEHRPMATHAERELLEAAWKRHFADAPLFFGKAWPVRPKAESRRGRMPVHVRALGQESEGLLLFDGAGKLVHLQGSKTSLDWIAAALDD